MTIAKYNDGNCFTNGHILLKVTSGKVILTYLKDTFFLLVINVSYLKQKKIAYTTNLKRRYMYTVKTGNVNLNNVHRPLNIKCDTTHNTTLNSELLY